MSAAPFPDRMSAFVWRNWGLVPYDQLLTLLGKTRDELYFSSTPSDTTRTVTRTT